MTTGSQVTMVSLPGGTFAMGYANGEEDERPVHEVTLDPFLIDKFEVTQAMFAAAQLPNPSHWQDDPELPVERVRWQDAKLYCNERSLLEGLEPCYDESAPGWPCDFSKSGYRLPTEAEWEYAARAGARGVYGDFGESRLAEHAVFESNGGERTAKVGSKQPNAWGIHDMYGNVAEWCHDVYEANYYDNSPSDNPRGPETDQEDALRVMRGGSWKATASMCRATFRQGQRTGDTDACFYTDYCGFRCVRRP
jgi:formylglycine-generating enzyme required for sulfatase activity